MKKRILDILLGFAVGGILGCVSFFIVSFIDTNLLRLEDFSYIPMAPFLGGLIGSFWFLYKKNKFSALGAIIGGPIVGFTFLSFLFALACATGGGCL